MTEPLRLFILAGEPSGDRIAADLVSRLRRLVSVDLVGVGGDELIGQGLKPLFPMSDLSVMGITDVIVNLPRLLWRLEQTARAILASRPDIVVLVDAQDFSRLLAARLRKRGYVGRLVLYVAPSVWARHPERASRLRPLFDLVLSVLPFEPEVMQRLGGPPTVYVGHPALGEKLTRNLVNDTGPLVLLPGSRAGELKRHLPVLRTLAPRLATMPGVSGLVVPTLPSLSKRLRTEFASWPVPVEVVDRRDERNALYARALAAICVSGTVTLELALASVPMVVIYALDGHQARVFERLGKPAVSLPNIILDRPVVPENVVAPLTAEAVAPTIEGLLSDKKARQDQIAAFGELVGMMEAGKPPFMREDPALQILGLLRDQRLLNGS